MPITIRVPPGKPATASENVFWFFSSENNAFPTASSHPKSADEPPHQGHAPQPKPDPELIRLLQRAQALRRAGDAPAAAAALEQALRRGPANAHLHHDLGLARLGLGETEAALRHFERAAALLPTLGVVHFRRGVALEMHDAQGAPEAYRKAIETAPALAEPYACLASAEEQVGRRVPALATSRLWPARCRTAPRPLFTQPALH